jgi:hypothetical protein
MTEPKAKPTVKLIDTDGNAFAIMGRVKDASYYGIWTNPFKRIVFSYCEGDTCLKTADNDDEYVKELLDIKQLNFENGYAFKGIDPGDKKT